VWVLISTKIIKWRFQTFFVNLDWTACILYTYIPTWPKLKLRTSFRRSHSLMWFYCEIEVRSGTGQCNYWRWREDGCLWSPCYFHYTGWLQNPFTLNGSRLPCVQIIVICLKQLFCMGLSRQLKNTGCRCLTFENIWIREGRSNIAWRKFNNERFHNVYPSSDIVRGIISGRIGGCRTHGRWEMHIEIWSENLKGSHLEDLDILKHKYKLQRCSPY
jgi:hypothetical protein